MYTKVAQMPVFAGRNNNPFIFAGRYDVEPAEALFAGLTLEQAQPLFAGVDRNEIVSLSGMDKGEIISLGRRGFRGRPFGEVGAGGAIAVGVGALVVSALVSFGVMTLASYTGARLAGCRRLLTPTASARA